MAQKRMFDKRITDSDKFVDLPNSSKALYFMAGMSADDRGFFQPRSLQKMNGFTDDDFKVLIAKGYLIPFESGVMVITDWNKNNWLDKRRINETEYIEELKLLSLINEKYELNNSRLASAKPPLSQYSIEENRIVENRIEKNSSCYFAERQWNRMLNGTEIQAFNEFDDTYGYENVIEAIKISCMRNRCTASYVKGILTKQPKKPSWMDKEIQKEEVSEEELKELEELLIDYREGE